MLGRFYYSIGKFREAERFFTEVIDQRRTDHRFVYDRFRLLAESGQWENALVDLAATQAADPYNEGIYEHRRALILLHQERHAACRTLCQTILSRKTPRHVPSDYWAAWTLAVVPYHFENYDRAQGIAQHFSAAQPQQWFYAAIQGAVLFRAGQYQDATEWLLTADRLCEPGTSYPPPPYIWNFLAMALQAVDQPDEARQWLQRAEQWTDEATRTHDAITRLEWLGPHDSSAKGWNRSGEFEMKPLYWNQRLTLQLLRREAGQIVSDSRQPDETSMPESVLPEHENVNATTR